MTLQCGLLFNLRNCPCASGHCLLATLALPDADRLSLDCVLSAECADVSSVLGDFHLLDLLSQRGTVPVAKCQKMLFEWTRRHKQRLLRSCGILSWMRTLAYLVPYLPVTPTSADNTSVLAHRWSRPEDAGLTLGTLRHFGGC